MKTETKAKYTPAPWEIDELNCPIDGEEFITIQQYQGMPICEVRGTNDMSYLEDDEMEEVNKMVIANANLISSAPELLEALEGIMSEIDNGRLVRNIDKDHEPNWAMKQRDLVLALNKAVKAIKKAKGQ